ncbi:MAG: hypothetical protein ACOH1I_10180 [Gallionellaceae bacterium]|jgi:hypothetical protein
MKISPKHLQSIAVILCFLSSSTAFSQSSLVDESAQAAAITAPVSPIISTPVVEAKPSLDKDIEKKNMWYFSWGYSRQQYAPSDIHVSQPGQGNDFTVHQAEASDFPSSMADTLSLTSEGPNLTGPQENVRIGKFLNPEKTFAVEFALDHSKYNTNIGQTAHVTGTINNQPVDTNMVLDQQTFDYQLHNGLNHLMIDAVWLRHLYGPEMNAGELQFISKVGAGILLPHADNTVLGKQNQVGPKSKNICCHSGDWWQINGWTVGAEAGFRYYATQTIYLELTGKVAYGVLRGVPVYEGTADQELWMSEEVLSVGFLL